ncbi:MAG: hypothetical protein SFU84_11280 [Gemmatimonadales bacterium]|nr:hypothetical protein [Gemmatimonadales bacterium]
MEYPVGVMPVGVELPAHSSDMVSWRSADRMEWLADVNAVFEHQRAVYAETPSDLAERRAKVFYERCFATPAMIVGENALALSLVDDLDAEDEARIEFDQVLGAFAFAPQGTHANTFFYVVGAPGSGKTSLVSWAITTQLRDHVDQGRLLFARLNLEAVEQGNTTFTLVTRLAHQILDKAYPHLPQVVRDDKMVQEARALLGSAVRRAAPEGGAIGGGVTAKEVGGAIAGLMRAIRTRQPTRLVIFLDNPDRHVVEPSGDGELDTLTQFLRCGVHANETLGSLGATFVSILRPGPFKALRARLEARAPFEAQVILNAANIFSLARPSLHAVVVARGKLLSWLAENVGQDTKTPAGRRERYERCCKDYESIVADIGRNRFIERADRLLNRSRRALVSAMGRHLWRAQEFRDEPSTAVRFIKQYPSGLMVLALGEKQLFATREGGFPNIYLAGNRNWRQRPYRWSGSYWIGTMVLRVLHESHGMSRATLGDLLTGPGAYSGDLLDRVLSDLNGAGTEGAIYREHTEPAPNDITATLRTSPRGHELVVRSSIVSAGRVIDAPHEAFGASFSYLQLIADDPALPAPERLRAVLARELRARFTSQDNYQYFQQIDEEKYRTRLRQMLRWKVPIVIQLASVLDLAWEIEEARYPSAFARLGRDWPSAVIRPTLEANVRETISALSDKPHLGDIQRWLPEEAELEFLRAETRAQLLETP